MLPRLVSEALDRGMPDIAFRYALISLRQKVASRKGLRLAGESMTKWIRSGFRRTPPAWQSSAYN